MIENILAILLGFIIGVFLEEIYRDISDSRRMRDYELQCARLEEKLKYQVECTKLEEYIKHMESEKRGDNDHEAA